jgi:hypothetical protein
MPRSTMPRRTPWIAILEAWLVWLVAAGCGAAGGGAGGAAGPGDDCGCDDDGGTPCPDGQYLIGGRCLGPASNDPRDLCAFTAQLGGGCVDLDGDCYVSGCGAEVDRALFAAFADCDDGRPDVHPGQAELCDGVDDDCDGNTDEGFDVGAECDDGCGTGKLECSVGDPMAVTCSTNAGQSAARDDVEEVCDGRDDDCDGRVDEDCRVDLPAAPGRGTPILCPDLVLAAPAAPAPPLPPDAAVPDAAAPDAAAPEAGPGEASAPDAGPADAAVADAALPDAAAADAGPPPAADPPLVFVEQGRLLALPAGGVSQGTAQPQVLAAGPNLAYPACGPGGLAWLELDPDPGAQACTTPDDGPVRCQAHLWTQATGDVPRDRTGRVLIGPPAIHDGAVLWHAIEGGRLELHRAPLDGGRVENVGENWSDPAPGPGDEVAVREWLGASTGVVLHSLAGHGDLTLRGPRDARPGPPALGADWAVWSLGKPATLWAVPVADAGAGFQVVDLPGDQLSPRVDGARAFWLDTGARSPTLRTLDLATGVADEVARGPLAAPDFTVRDGLVVWIRHDPAGDLLYRHRVE